MSQQNFEKTVSLEINEHSLTATYEPPVKATTLYCKLIPPAYLIEDPGEIRNGKVSSITLDTIRPGDTSPTPNNLSREILKRAAARGYILKEQTSDNPVNVEKNDSLPAEITKKGELFYGSIPESPKHLALVFKPPYNMDVLKDIGMLPERSISRDGKCKVMVMKSKNLGNSNSERERIIIGLAETIGYEAILRTTKKAKKMLSH